jgi:hypothetical protein
MPIADTAIIASDHDQILHDQEAERDLAVQRIDLALVRQQLDDDDGRGKGQGHRHVEAGDRGRRPRPRPIR